MNSVVSSSLPSIRSTIVIGGGLAGIAAALALAKHGVHVTLLESRRKLGGRTGSFTRVDPQTGNHETIDYCQHVGMGCCTNLKQLIYWLDQTNDWHEQRQLHFFGPQGDYQQLSAWPLLPAPLHLAGWLLKWPGLKNRDRIAIARGMLAIRGISLTQTNQQSALAWLRSHGQTPAAIDHFWTTILVSALGEQLEQVSLTAMAKVLQDGFLNHRRAFHLLVPQRPLGELFGSRALQVLHAHGVDVRLEQPVKQLQMAEQQPLTVVCAGQAQAYQADSVVIAVPWHQLEKISIADDACDVHHIQSLLRGPNRLHSSAITGIHTWWDRPWLQLPHAAIVGRLCQWVFPSQSLIAPPESLIAPPIKSKTLPTNTIPDHPSPSPHPTSTSTSHYYQIVISATNQLRQLGAKQISEQVHADLCHVFPAVRQAKLLRSQVVTDPQAVFSITPESQPYRLDSFVHPRLMLAGDWTATGWPATMEGAILSGFRAAENLLAAGNSTRPQIVCPPLR